MKNYSVFLPELERSVPVIVERKRMKTCRLKVFPDKTIKLSVPKCTTDYWINHFLSSKSQWLGKKLQEFDQIKKDTPVEELVSGVVIHFLGADLICVVLQDHEERVYREDGRLYLCVRDINDQNKLFALFDKWWRKESMEVIEVQNEKFYPIIEKYQIDKPQIKLRKMKTLWGSCSPHRNTITFNQYLTKAPIDCVAYVVLHELTHFIHPNHSKQFYDFLKDHMPDWRERRRELNLNTTNSEVKRF